MNALGLRAVVIVLVLGLCLGTWAAWAWQAKRYGQQLSAQAEAHRLDREQAVVAVTKD